MAFSIQGPVKATQWVKCDWCLKIGKYTHFLHTGSAFSVIEPLQVLILLCVVDPDSAWSNPHTVWQGNSDHHISTFWKGLEHKQILSLLLMLFHRKESLLYSFTSSRFFKRFCRIFYINNNVFNRDIYISYFPNFRSFFSCHMTLAMTSSRCWTGVVSTYTLVLGNTQSVSHCWVCCNCRFLYMTFSG